MGFKVSYYSDNNDEYRMIVDAVKLAWTAVAYWPPKEVEVYQSCKREGYTARIKGHYGEVSDE